MLSITILAFEEIVYNSYTELKYNTDIGYNTLRLT